MNRILQNLILLIFFTTIPNISRSQKIVQDVKYDVAELKCLVCEAVVDELLLAKGKLNQDIKVPVGRYNLDAKNNNQKTVPLHKSEVHLTELMDKICAEFDNYVRGTKDNKLTIIPMVLPNGGYNPEMSQISIIQDADLNKSLRFYCENITEEWDEIILENLIKDKSDMKTDVCVKTSQICPSSDEGEDDQNYYFPGNDEL
ncbi:protein seele [Chrysoperla carnea]|uniref:protein seele n=1 Tax=Chrysoperla carnea TaxID=189513 RepID=UPI001D060AEF|nr:protein seele [Chrysoperla carnea]